MMALELHFVATAAEEVADAVKLISSGKTMSSHTNIKWDDKFVFITLGTKCSCFVEFVTAGDFPYLFRCFSNC